MNVDAFPLAWPLGRSRVPDRERQRATFRTPFGKARSEVLIELSRIGVPRDRVVISTNIPVRLDGLPYANERTVDGDPGVAVYFTNGHRAAPGRPAGQLCVACDRWDTVAANLHAIGLTLEALRAVGRWGTSQMVEAAFTGFAALPAPPAGPHWSKVLGVAAHTPADQVEAVYRQLSLSAHPDRGGSTERQAELNRAWEECRRERGLK